MPYEYFLRPIGDKQTFAPEILDGMHKYLESIPSYRWEDGSYVIFRTEEDKNRRVPQLLVSSGNDYLDPIVNIKPGEVMLSIVLDPDVDQYLYNFVLWCQKHCYCQLSYAEENVSPEELLVEP